MSPMCQKIKTQSSQKNKREKKAQSSRMVSIQINYAKTQVQLGHEQGHSLRDSNVPSTCPAWAFFFGASSGFQTLC